MMAMDLARFAALMTIPAAYALGWLSFAQLLVVSIVVAAAKIAFNAASGASLKALVQPDDLLVANAGSSPPPGPPSWSGRRSAGPRQPPRAGDDRAGRRGQLPAVGLRVTRHPRPGTAPAAAGENRGTGSANCSTAGGTSWPSPALRALFLNNLLVGGLIMATEPLLAVLLLRQLRFPPWQYGLAFAAPCVGGLIGSRLARRVVARYGGTILRIVGTLRAVWLIGLAFVRPGVIGLMTVMAVELAIIISMSLYNPVLATYRLQHTPRTASPVPCRPGRSAAAPRSPS